jgi:two-component system chemotaxis response regulator CheB
LTQLLTALPADLPVPLLVVQHMPPVFTRALAERLNEKCPFEVREAQDGDPLTPGQVLIAPGGRHMLLRRQGAVSQVRLTEDPPENSCRPALDPTLRAVAETYGTGVLAVVLTGMGQDGLIGCQRVKHLGGRVLIQDRASSVVWGMPGAVHAAGAFDEMLALNALAGAIVRQVARGLRHGKRA